MKEESIKVVLAVAVAALLSELRTLIVPLIVLVCVMGIDYATGLMKAWYTASLSSRVGITGILKKAGYLIMVAVAMVLDWVIRNTCGSVGVALPVDFVFSLLMTVWLVINECISILENTAAIGVPMPKFLMKALEKLKTSVEEQAGGESENSD
jgi:toxin secretion/phage lysis holin